MSYIMPRPDPRTLSPEDVDISMLAFDITRSVRDYLGSASGATLTPAHILAFSQRAWRLNPAHADGCGLILAVCRTPDLNRRQVMGVFRRGRGGTDRFMNSPVDTPNRYVVLLEPADEEEWNRFTGHFLPDRKPGEANPVRYFE